MNSKVEPGHIHMNGLALDGLDGWDNGDDDGALEDVSSNLLPEGRPPQMKGKGTEESPLIHSKGGILLLNTFHLGCQFLWLCLTVLIIPSQIRSLVVEERKGLAVGILTACGAIVSLAMSPIMGIATDRCTLRHGRRRPYMALGTALLCVSLLGMAFAAPVITPAPTAVHERCKQQDTLQGAAMIPGSSFSLNYIAYVAAYMLVSAAYVMVQVPYAALMADCTPRELRGLSSGVMGAMTTVGMLLGALSGAFLTDIGIVPFYGLIIGLLCLTGTITMCYVKEIPITRKSLAPIRAKNVLLSYVEPLANHDFRWVFLTRFLMQQGVSTIVGFLAYSASDRFTLPSAVSAETAVSILLGVLLSMSMFSAVGAGYLSDRMGGRRKALVIPASLVMAACSLMFATVTAYQIIIGVAAFYGLAYGAFLSVDFAMVIDVLPAAHESAKDLAVWHAAIALPNLIAAPMGGIIRDVFQKVHCGCACGFGYVMLYVVAAVYFLLCALFITRIKGVR